MSCCAKCNIRVNRLDALSHIICSNCSNSFHRECVNMNENEIAYIKKDKHTYNWLCTSCSSKNRRRSSVLRDEKEVHNASDSFENNDDVFVLDNKNIAESLKKIMNTMNELSKNMKERLDVIEKSVKMIEQVIEENQMLKQKVDLLEEKVENLEQLALCGTVDILNVPFDTSESVTDKVCMICEKLNIKVNKEDVIKCYRLKNFSVNKPGKIVVKFSSVNISNKITAHSKRTKLQQKMFNPQIDDNKLIYINPTLTQNKRKLYAEAKKLQSSLNYKFLWMKNSTILMRKNEGGEVYKINKLIDLERLPKNNHQSNTL